MKERVVLKKSIFPASQEVIWRKLQQLCTLQYIAAPFASFTPLKNTEDLLWREGETFHFRFKLFSLLPLGTHTIHVLSFDNSSYEIYTNETNTHVPVWNHRIYLKFIDDHITEYTDEVEIYAGWKTIFVYTWAKLFYRHRQRKWIKMLKSIR